MLGRFIATAMAKHETIITQDDDVLVTNWDQLRERYESTGRIVTNLSRGHFAQAEKDYTIRDSAGDVVGFESLLGFGSIFHRDRSRVLVDALYSRPSCFDLMRRKADRMFCILQQSEHELIEQKIRHLPGATRAMALYKRKDHWKLTDAARRECVEIVKAWKCESTL